MQIIFFLLFLPQVVYLKFAMKEVSFKISSNVYVNAKIMKFQIMKILTSDFTQSRSFVFQ